MYLDDINIELEKLKLILKKHKVCLNDCQMICNQPYTGRFYIDVYASQGISKFEVVQNKNLEQLVKEKVKITLHLLKAAIEEAEKELK